MLPDMSEQPVSPPLLPSSGPGFTDLGVSPRLALAAAAAGWAAPTAIQVAVLPAALRGRDVLGIAPTGSGKTAAFLLPLLQRLLCTPGLADEKPRRLRALVLAPTRELALQIAEVADRLAAHAGATAADEGATLSSASASARASAAAAAAASAPASALKTVVAVGGVSINPQMMALRGGAHLVVATPGRLLDLLAQRALTLGDVATLVLDEADRLLDLGFADEIGRLLALLPERRQSLLFSATMPDAVARLSRSTLRDALRVEVAPAAAGEPQDIQQRAIEVDTAHRTLLLRHLIAQQRWSRVLVFTATQYASEHVADKLRQAGVAAASLHGGLSQGRRSQVLADFHSGALTVLVATDLAARGLDVLQLPVVVNHDLPRSAVDYTHRIGRTGRAGAAGLAISFICADAPGSEAHFRLIEKRQQQRVPRERVAGFEPAPTAAATPPADPQGGVKGKRKSKKDKLREAEVAAAARG